MMNEHMNAEYNRLLKGAYRLVDELATKRDKLIGDDPYREMNEKERVELNNLTVQLDAAWAEMKRLEQLESATAEHSGEQADF